jgi:hypothetical protein
MWPDEQVEKCVVGYKCVTSNEDRYYKHTHTHTHPRDSLVCTESKQINVNLGEGDS